MYNAYYLPSDKLQLFLEVRIDFKDHKQKRVLQKFRERVTEDWHD